MDISDNFKIAFTSLRKNPLLVLPFLLSQLSFYLIFYLFLSSSGLFGLFSSQLSQSQINELFQSLFNWDLLLLFLIYMGVYLVVEIFIINIGFYQNSKILVDSKFRPHFFRDVKDSMYYFWKFFIIRLVVISVFIFSPILLFLLFMWFIELFRPLILENPSFIIVLILLYIISIIVLFMIMIFISLKLFYAEAILFFEKRVKTQNLSSLSILKQSHNFSRGKMLKILIIFLIIVAIYMLINTASPDQLLYSIASYEISTTEQIFGLTFAFLLVVLHATLLCFNNLFLLNSYLKLKKKAKNKN